ncbi:ABC transporter ATP-binding protein [Candidatus Pandoraea novymonadis]|uniref:Phospholipid import ATP-binding protein MlaF n=1 Tax=Candidatus Pandoraea novymonadis TaxID=1808959 RepID=A0ABX5FCL7_9BURK|nr:ABC transporter ATP-binding protein [Candidatus Pandoraea novymonadis]PSB91568.1 putative phospholipid import ATP-binding protein MlaF [Candidatus Pandoraea novymonadis]
MTRLSSENLLELHDVSFHYGERQILSGLNMRISHGKVVAVMGGSGCGKTTLLRLIGGQYQPDDGFVYFRGQDVSSLDPAALQKLRREMGVLFQFGALFADMTVFDNVAFPMREHTNLGEEMIRDLVLMKLNAVGLRSVRDLKPSEISGGMARRVALARAIALDPKFIMYDEPFAGLDPISMSITANLIRTLNDALGATSILVTHDVRQSFLITDYIYFIADGNIAAEGTPLELRASQDPVVRRFFDDKLDGPAKFHYSTKSMLEDFRIGMDV